MHTSNTIILLVEGGGGVAENALPVHVGQHSFFDVSQDVDGFIQAKLDFFDLAHSVGSCEL